MCSFDEFKKSAKEFNDSIDTLNIEELDNAWKCLGIQYLSMDEEMWLNSSAILYEMMCKKYIERERTILMKEDN